MALRTLGTNANNSLTALIVGTDDFGTAGPANIAQFNLHVKDDLVNGQPVLNQCYQKKGLLFVPNRGELRLHTGDYVWYDSTGCCGVVFKYAIANGPWTHT